MKKGIFIIIGLMLCVTLGFSQSNQSNDSTCKIENFKFKKLSSSETYYSVFDFKNCDKSPILVIESETGWLSIGDKKYVLCSGDYVPELGEGKFSHIINSGTKETKFLVYILSLKAGGNLMTSIKSANPVLEGKIGDYL